MKYRLEVRRADCISAAACVVEAPQTFRIDEEDIAVIIDPAGDDPESIRAAAESCPTNAIVLIDAESGEQLWPEE